MGMSASIFTTIYVAAFRPEALSFLLFITVGPAVLGLLAMPFLDAPQGKQLHSQEGRDTGLSSTYPVGLSSDNQCYLAWTQCMCTLATHLVHAVQHVGPDALVGCLSGLMAAAAEPYNTDPAN